MASQSSSELIEASLGEHGSRWEMQSAISIYSAADQDLQMVHLATCWLWGYFQLLTKGSVQPIEQNSFIQARLEYLEFKLKSL